MNIKIVDTTLRDGEQTPGIALGVEEKIKIATILDSIGIYQIEAGIPAMEGDEMKSVRRIAELGLKSKISAWNRMNIRDIEQSAECGVDIIHISVPSSDIQIHSKLKKDRAWVIENVRRCISYAVEKGFEVTIGLEDASRAEKGFLVSIIQTALAEGVKRVRYADTVGILLRKRAADEIAAIIRDTGAEVEIHAHNDFGMAVANSIAAVQAGAGYANCTVGGIGERAGNCDFVCFLNAARECMGQFMGENMQHIMEAQKEILGVIRRQLPAVLPPLTAPIT